MIKNIINNALQSNARLINESKDRVISVAKKRAEEQYGDKLPDPTDLRSELEPLRSQIVTPDQAVKAEQKCNKALSLCDRVINKLDGSIKELENIKGKTDKINNNFSKINERIEVIRPIAEKLNILTRALGFSLLALNTFTGITGKQVKDLGDLIDSAKDKVSEFLALVNAVPTTVNYYQNEVNKIAPAIDKGIAGLNSAKTLIESLKQALIAALAAFIASLQYPQYEGYSEEEIIDDLNTNIDNEGEITVVTDNDSGFNSIPDMNEDTLFTFETTTGIIFVLTTTDGIATKYEYKNSIV